ncbi:MAG: hypothetical protein JWO80_3617 [Bryobacterales bacterium]|nr:hypothetical protein [Bryobacterales bacterium]
MLEVEWVEPSGWLRIATALLEDISTEGACLQMESAIPISTSVELRYGGVAIPALVKYCVYREIGYYVGVEFREGFRWSEQRFHPQHLLDLKKLARKAVE